MLAEFLERSGLPVPAARTGASITAVDDEVVASLYAARLTCSGGAVPALEVLDIVGCTLQPQGFIALLGRDFLRKVVLVYDGSAGSFTPL